MKIQLQQTDIIAALKMYIASRGIGLTNMNVEISFTAKRKEGGLTADVDIQEATAGSATPATEVPEKVSAEVVPMKATTDKAPKAKPVEAEEVAEAAPTQADADAAFDGEVVPEVAEAAEEPVVEPKPKASLFG